MRRCQELEESGLPGSESDLEDSELEDGEEEDQQSATKISSISALQHFTETLQRAHDTAAAAERLHRQGDK